MITIYNRVRISVEDESKINNKIKNIVEELKSFLIRNKFYTESLKDVIINSVIDNDDLQLKVDIYYKNEDFVDEVGLIFSLFWMKNFWLNDDGVKQLIGKEEVIIYTKKKERMVKIEKLGLV
jgi:hypothetical protein